MKNKDKDLHDPKISELYRQLPAEEPSEHTDAAIHAAARRAVAAGPQKKWASFGARQFMATAAVLVLGVGLVVQWQVHEPEKLQEALSSTATVTTTPTAEAPAAKAAPATEVPAAESEPALAAKPASSAAKMAARERRQFADSNAVPVMTPSAAPPMPAPSAPPAIAESRIEADSSDMAPAPQQAMPAGAAKENIMASEMEKSLRREVAADRAAAAQGAVAARLMQEKKAEAAAKATAPLSATADYRIAMSNGDYAQALLTLQSLIQADADAALLVDRDMLRMLQGNKKMPECTRLSAEKLGGEKLLCELLLNLTKGKNPPTDWNSKADMRPLLEGEKAYRRRAAETLFSTKN